MTSETTALLPPVRILFVEDNRDLREIFTEMMEADGLIVTPCADAEQALALFDVPSPGAPPFDLLVTDVSLPGLSGADLAREVLRRRPDFPVVLCTGYPIGADAARLGRNVLALSKPFEPEELTMVIERLLGPGRNASASPENTKI